MAIRGRLRLYFKRFCISINVIVSILFLIACLAPYISTSDWPSLGFFGLAFPYLSIFLLLFIFFWLTLNAKWSILSIVTLLIGWKQLSIVFAINKYETFIEKKDRKNIRILNWNIRSLEGLSTKADKKRTDRVAIPVTIIEQNADIVCLQEFNNSAQQNNVEPLRKQYPYYFFSRDFSLKKKSYQAGAIIFSKYPIVDSGRIIYPGTSSESLIYADIKTPGKIIRVFTTHLQSFKFKPEDYEDIEQIKSNDEDAILASKNLFQKMKIAYKIRGTQARIVRKELEQSPYPALICGDFNDVPNSYTYFEIRKDWQDAFLTTSLGIGRTYLAIAPTLRIDYFLPDNNFIVRQFDLVDEVLSDHLMIVADISIR